MTAWTEGKIARALARNTFADSLCCLPNCVWTGDEIDLLVVPPCLRVVEVEIKISRADLRADKNKAKWWHRPYWDDYHAVGPRAPPRAVAYPRRVWKHYYAMPAEIWRENLLADVQPVSGVLLVSAGGPHGVKVECVKRAKPRRDAEPIGAAGMRELARLASLRMWDAYLEVERMQASLGVVTASLAPQVSRG